MARVPCTQRSPATGTCCRCDVRYNDCGRSRWLGLPAGRKPVERLSSGAAEFDSQPGLFAPRTYPRDVLARCPAPHTALLKNAGASGYVYENKARSKIANLNSRTPNPDSRTPNGPSHLTDVPPC